MSVVRRAFCAFVLLWVSYGCIQAELTSSPAKLDSGILRTYLTTHDSRRATELLATLLHYPLKEIVRGLEGPLPFPNSPKGVQPSRTISLDGKIWRYGLYVPEDYDSARAYPLIVCLHGAGFDGDSYLDRWQPRLGSDYVLACPTMEFGAWWTREAERLVVQVLKEITRAYHIDRDRIFVTGMSNGGIGTYLIGLNYADLFAAYVPMAAALPGPLMSLLDNGLGVPFYLIHGKHDQVIAPEYSRKVEAYLRERRHDVIYREHDRQHAMAGGHFFPREELPALLEWLALQKRAPWPHQVKMVRDRDHPGKAYWIRIDEIDPAAGSFWASETDSRETQRLKDGQYARIEATLRGDNEIIVESQFVRRYTVLLSPSLINFEKPVRITTNGELSFQGIVEPDIGILLEEARSWFDPGRLFFSSIEVSIGL